MQYPTWIAGADCPECGVEIAPGAPVCPTCGFELLEAPNRPLPRPSWRLIAAATIAALALIAGVLINTRGPQPEAPRPVSAAAAERRLERVLTSFEGDDTASVRCPGPISRSAVTRCRVRYARGGVQPILVQQLQWGAIEVDIP